ncbi:MAG: transposase [Bradyrhizobium icense]|jgi:catechol 2,3-dioxygenase-like lactoylglutathione lyase family enzyme|nr:MAG: transposase [Bradyrhizobium icense]
MMRNPDHVTIAVADAERAIAFFALLGFRKDHVATIDGGVPARYMGMPGMKAQHITLVLEGAKPHFEIQLLAFDGPAGSDPGAHPTNLRKLGFNHLAFRVDDIEETTAHLTANGVTMLSEEMDYIGRKLRLFEGPEGITFELVQRDD